MARWDASLKMSPSPPLAQRGLYSTFSFDWPFAPVEGSDSSPPSSSCCTYRSFQVSQLSESCFSHTLGWCHTCWHCSCWVICLWWIFHFAFSCCSLVPSFPPTVTGLPQAELKSSHQTYWCLAQLNCSNMQGTHRRERSACPIPNGCRCWGNCTSKSDQRKWGNIQRHQHRLIACLKTISMKQAALSKEKPTALLLLCCRPVGWE